MKKAMVTGGAGFIGGHLTDALIVKGWEVVVVDDLSVGRRENVNPSAKLEVFDIADENIDALLQREQPDAVFHLAAQKSVTVSVREPAVDARTNILGSIHLLQACAKSGVKRFVFSSTGGAIYDERGTLPATEENRELPLSPYGIGKLAVDHYLRFFQECYNLSSISLRYANVYGPRQDPYGEAGVVAIFFSKMLAKETPTINGDGNQTRDYIYIDDVVQANLLAVESQCEGVYNIGTEQETSVNDLYRAIVRIGGFHAKETHGPAKSGEMLRSCLTAIKAREDLHWVPSYDLERGLQNTFQWFKEGMV